MEKSRHECLTQESSCKEWTVDMLLSQTAIHSLPGKERKVRQMFVCCSRSFAFLFSFRPGHQSPVVVVFASFSSCPVCSRARKICSWKKEVRLDLRGRFLHIFLTDSWLRFRGSQRRGGGDKGRDDISSCCVCGLFFSHCHWRHSRRRHHSMQSHDRHRTRGRLIISKQNSSRGFRKTVQRNSSVYFQVKRKKSLLKSLVV